MRRTFAGLNTSPDIYIRLPHGRWVVLVTDILNNPVDVLAEGDRVAFRSMDTALHAETDLPNGYEGPLRTIVGGGPFTCHFFRMGDARK
jgi:hypothetical protein